MPNYYRYQQYNRTRMNLLTAPTEEPITLAEAKSYLGINIDTDDCKVANWITSTRQAIEAYLGIAIMSQTWQLFFDVFPFYSRWIVSNPLKLELPKSPLASVTHIKHYDESDVATTIAASEYQVSTYTASNPWNGRIAFKDTFSAPSLSNMRNMDSTEIQFVAGYADPDDVPQIIKTAMMQELAFRNNIQSSGSLDSESVNGVYSVKYGGSNGVGASGLSETTTELLKPLKKVRI